MWDSIEANSCGLKILECRSKGYFSLTPGLFFKLHKQNSSVVKWHIVHVLLSPFYILRVSWFRGTLYYREDDYSKESTIGKKVVPWKEEDKVKRGTGRF